MPIEVNRINKECPKCKSPQIFDTGKNFYCGKCLTEFPKQKTAKDTVPDDVRENLGIPDNAIVEEMEEVKCDIHEGDNDSMCTRCGKESMRHRLKLNWEFAGVRYHDNNPENEIDGSYVEYLNLEAYAFYVKSEQKWRYLLYKDQKEIEDKDTDFIKENDLLEFLEKKMQELGVVKQ